MACTCLPVPISVTPSTPSGDCNDNCLILGNFYQIEADAAGPCGAVGFIPFEDSCVDTSVCTSTPVFSIVSVSSNLDGDNTTIDATGITYTTGDATSAGTEFEISYKIQCGNFGGIAVAKGRIKNLCKSPDCATGEECDPCTGNCVPEVPDAVLS